MAAAKVRLIMIRYRRATVVFETVARAVQFLRQDTIRTYWLRMVTADVHLMSDDGGIETLRLKGQKSTVLRALEQLERALGG